MKKDLLLEKRKKAKELYAKSWSCRKIARYLIASRDSVRRWVKMDEEELLTDDRGWKKGRLRTNTEEAKQGIISLREQLLKEDSFFIGAKVIQSNYRKIYGKDISRWLVDHTLRESGLANSLKPKEKGRSKYMKYPAKTINKLGKIMMSMDFVGPRYLQGRGEGINFITCKYIRPNKEGIAKRVPGQTAEEAIRFLKEIWRTHPIPDVLRIDNDSAFGANLSHQMCFGRLTYFLLNLGVKPLYIAPRSPWNNGAVEGFNSIFSKKFWNHLKFTDEEEIDIKIKDFNVAYEKYSRLIDNNAEIKNPKYITDFEGVDFDNRQINKFRTHKVYFLRIVRRLGDKGDKSERGYINILGKEINIDKNLINIFVFCELNIKEERLVIKFEDESGKLREIKQIKFKIKNVISN